MTFADPPERMPHDARLTPPDSPFESIVPPGEEECAASCLSPYNVDVAVPAGHVPDEAWG